MEMMVDLGKKVVVLLLLFLGLGFTCFAQQTLAVPDDYPTIQSAIDAAQPEDTVYVKAGRYTESLVIDKPLSLIGEGRTKTIIQSPDSENDVVEVNLSSGEVSITGLKVYQGRVGILLHLAAGAKASVTDVIAYENGVGIYTMGEGEFLLAGSFLIDCELAGLWLASGVATVEENEILRGGMGIVLSGAVKATLVGNLIGLSNRGIDTYTTACGYAQTEERFPGTVRGDNNRVYGLKTDLCPESSDSLWPAGFLDASWKDAIDQVVADYERGAHAHQSQDYVAALAAYTEGLLALEKASFPILAASLDQDIGVVYDDLGQYEDALAAYQSARVVYVDRQMEVNVANVDVNIGVVYRNLGRYEDALAACQSARAVYVDRQMEVAVAEIDQNIGVVYSDLGRYEDALAAYQSARVVYVDRQMEVNVAAVDTNIGNVYRNLGRYEDALAAYQSARAVYVDRQMEVDVADVDTNIGNVYTNLGRYEDALAAYQSARAVYVDRQMEVAVAEIDQNIGVVYRNLGRYEDALRAYEGALDLLDEIPPLPGMTYSYPATRWVILKNKGICHERLLEWDQAIEAYEDSITVIESLRGYMKSEELKTAWQERTQDVYECLIKLLIDQGQGSSAFMYAERCRARTFLDALYQGSIAPNQLISPEAGISSGAVDPKAIDQAVADARDSLQGNEAVLEYMVTDTGVYLWVITKETISDPIFIKYERAQLMNDVITLRQAIETLTADPITATEFLVFFYDKLVKESLAKLPDGVDTLILIPSGPLWYLPFSALIMTDQGRVPSGGLGTRSPYILEHYTLAYLPSLASLSSLTKEETQTAEGIRLLALADPELSPDQLRASEGSKCGEEKSLGRYEQLVTACQEFAKRLVGEVQEEQCVYAGKEAQEVRAHKDTGRQVVVYAAHGQFNPYVPLQSKLLLAPGGEAANLQTDSRVLDGNYHAWETLLTDYRGTELVILAACETLLPHLSNLKGTLAVLANQECDQVELTPQQLEQIVVGDEVVGLARAFLSSGAEAVLGTLWLANPTAIGKLLTSMADYHNKGNTWVQALTNAQRDLIKGATFSNPWFWAPYQLIGRWR
jgi:CHAT domain-containing protein